LDFRKLNCFWLKRLHLVALFNEPSAFADIADHPAQQFCAAPLSFFNSYRNLRLRRLTERHLGFQTRLWYT